MKVDDKRHRFPGELEIRQHRRCVDTLQLFDRLQFDDNRVVDEQIDSITAVERDTLVDKRNPFLPLDSETATGQLEREARFVRRFEQPRTKVAMNTNGGGTPPVIS